VHLRELAELLAADGDGARGGGATGAYPQSLGDLVGTDQGGPSAGSLNQSLSNTTLPTDSSGY